MFTGSRLYMDVQAQGAESALISSQGRQLPVRFQHRVSRYSVLRYVSRYSVH